jgi:ADP-heptose:LPS heptosyltransferase
MNNELIKSLTFFSDDLIGDAIMQSPTIRNLKIYRPDLEINYRCREGSVSYLIHSRNPYIDNILVGDKQESDISLNCSKAMEVGSQAHVPMIDAFASQLSIPLINKDYIYVPTQEDLDTAKQIFETELGGKPFVLIGRHSWSCTSHDESLGNKPNKCFSNMYWKQIADYLHKMGVEPVAIGSLKDSEEDRFSDWSYTKMYGKPIEHIAALMTLSNGVLSVDTGVRFLAAAVGANFLVISCALPNWLVSAKPQFPNQLGIELNMPVTNIDVNFITPLLMPLFKGANDVRT